MADTQLLLQAAGAAVQEHQAGKLAPSVEDILHLEKRWNKLPGASAGSVSLQDATTLLGAEVLEGEPLEFVVRQVFGGAAAPPPVLSKRQFLSLAHVAEVAQGKAFDLVTAEDALRAQEPPASHRKRPPTIRDAHIDTWHIAAGRGGAEHTAAAPQYEAAAAAVLATAAPGPLESHLSRADSLALPAGPLEQGVQALSRHNSSDGLAEMAAAGGEALEEEEAAEEEPDHAAVAAARLQHQSGATSYQSIEEMASAAEEEGEVEEGREGLDAADEFATKLTGLMRAVSGDVGRAHPEAPPHTPEGLLPADDSAAAVTAGGGEAPAAGKARSSWESFNSTPGSAGAAAAAQQASLAAAAAHTPPQQQQMNEAVISAAMAAGMTFMQHLQAAGAAGAPAPSPFSDVNPLRHAAAAAAAMASNPGMGAPQLSRAASFVPPSPDVHPPGAQRPQQVIAEMMAHLNLGDASPAQLQAAATTLQQQAMAMQQHHHHHQPAASRQGSMGSSAASGDAAHHHTGQQHSARSEGVRRSWRAFEGEQAQLQAQLQAQQQEAGRLVRRQRAAAAVTVDVQPPRASGIAGWEPMSGDDVHRCRSIFAKKGYPAVGGMEKHCAMEYFAKLHMERHIFHQAWQAADRGGRGRLGERDFCLFVQLLRGAQKGRPLPAALSEGEAAALLGEAPMPGGGAAPLHIDAAHLRSVLGHSRQASLAGHEVAESVLQGFDPDDDDDASSVDSGIAESVSGMSVCSLQRPSHHPAGGHYALARPSAQPHHRTGLGSVLGGGAPSYHPAATARPGYGAGDSQAAHSQVEVAVNRAEVRYRKALSTPIFTLSVRDSLGRLVELPIDTHPGHYRRETSTIHSSAIVKLATQLQHIPPGSILYLEIKHWKSDKKRFSTLAWSYAPLDKLVDFGPSAARVRNGPLDLPLFKKPVDLTLRRTKRLTSRAFDLHLTVRGIE